jgi:hypothetical protein
MTHTYAFLEVLPSTWHDVRKRLEQADYVHAFHDNAIDMHGLALIEMRRPPYEGESIFARIERGDYDYPIDDVTGEVDTNAIERFNREALHFVGLTDHPKATEIFNFCTGLVAHHVDLDIKDTVGFMRKYKTEIVRKLETIASFMQ